MRKLARGPGRFLCAERCERRARVSRVKPRSVEHSFSGGPGRGSHGTAGESRDSVGVLGWSPEQLSLSSFDRLPLSVNNLGPPFKSLFKCFNGRLCILLKYAKRKI